MNTVRTTEHCRDERRRDLVRNHTDAYGQPDRNGIDYIEVSDDQRKLTVFFLGRAPEISVANVRIDGGQRVTVRVVDVRLCRADDPDQDDCLTVFVDRPGDFSTYTLRLVEAVLDRPGTTPLAGFDPRYAGIPFSFKVNCPSELDCAAATPCPTEPSITPEINYLAKDYASFRQLILDRLALLMPDWRERHVPDIGIALVELLAYSGDYLSYYQDAVATEAYLDTARRRISVRRHARLVDYGMHEGCNARAWVCVEIDTDASLPTNDLFFVTGPGHEVTMAAPVLGAADLANAPTDSYEVFEPLAAPATIQLYAAHSRISFYTWGNAECCLPRGTTSATLRDAWIAPPGDDNPPGKDQPSPQSPARTYPDNPAPPEWQRALHLVVGDVLIFEEVISPTTGLAADANRAHRHAVRLTRVESGLDLLIPDPDADSRPTPIVEIEWAEADALPWALCLSAVGGEDCALIEDVSVARGNALLVDHGRSTGEELPAPPAATTTFGGCCGVGKQRPPRTRPGPYDPVLAQTPLTFAAPFPASSAIVQRQAEILSGLFGRVQAFVQALWQRAQDDQPLTPDEIEQLRTIFGAQALINSGLTPRARTNAPPKATPNSAEQAAALRWLITHEAALLRSKVQRIATLSARAQSGHLLDAVAVAEIGALFGTQFVADLQPGAAALYGPASGALAQNVREAGPHLRVHGRAPDTNSPLEWLPRPDLLASSGADRHVVVEIDNEGRAHLRFGDGTLGAAPAPGGALRAAYRVGNGAAGNVGAEAITRLVLRGERQDIGVQRVRNPLPAQGGSGPEPISEVKLFAPSAFRRELARAVIADDYARLAERVPGVQRAAATLRWSGSWHDVHVMIDAQAHRAGDARLLDEVRTLLARFQRIGHAVTVAWARTVSIRLEIDVCVRDGYTRGQVKAALLDALGNRLLPNGQRGLFHPDNVTFGTSIALSRIVALAQAIPGVETVSVRKLERLHEGSNGEIAAGVLTLGANEIARLDNDPLQPENGILVLTLRGGR